MPKKLYGSVNGVTKQIKKLYGSVNGVTKEIKKLYGSVNGVTKQIFPQSRMLGVVLSHKAETDAAWVSDTYYDQSSLLSAINALKALYGATLFDIKLEEEII